MKMEENTGLSPLKHVKKISDVLWELPKDYKKGMLVPARIVASEKLLNEMDIGVFNQIANVAALPGIVNYAYCMPDAHWGYGFPIGGVAAFDVNNGGVISPGGVGFDVSCLTPDSRIFLANGTWKKIGDLEKNWRNKEFISFDITSRSIKNTNSILFLKKQEEEYIYEIITESGRKIKITKEHPLLTEKGFIIAEKLKKGDYLYIKPFSGVEYEYPQEEPIISEKEILKKLDNLGISNIGNAKSQIINFLRKKELLNLSYTSKKTPIILKIMGFIFGDGSINLLKKSKKGIISFYGNPSDLNTIKEDLRLLGFNIKKIFSRERKHEISTNYGLIKFNFKESSLSKKSTALAVLLISLGTPYSTKATQAYRVPKWIMKAPLWQKRLFLAALFGAELSSPKQLKNTNNFYSPQFNMNKLVDLKENAEAFLNDIRLILSEFGITSTYPVIVEGNKYNGKKGKTIGFRILIQSNQRNLIKLYEKVGYEYNKSKSDLAAIVANYLRFKKIIKLKRKKTRILALNLYNSGKTPSEIRTSLTGKYISTNFINHSIWPDRSSNTRASPNFIPFKEYKKNFVGGGILLDKINKIKMRPYSGYVYDMTINDKDHTFIANNIISHNCGMRLILTNLTYNDVKPHLKDLINNLFKRVPAGVGGTGFVKLNKEEFKKVLNEGSKWAVKNGYGWEEDLERTEIEGMANWADVSKVSSKAIDRGYNQIGTLGSGNHYLEIQRVAEENIFDKKLAKKWGLFPDQIVIMFHTGSRGEGHQIATDYLRLFLGVMEKKYNIKILDRELACAPFYSPEGQDYWKAMGCAVNFSLANRQTIAHRIREVFSDIFKQDPESLGLHQVFDISHNKATLEKYKIDGELKELLVHRKGATASYYPGREEIPKLYREDGLPVIIGGSMNTGSYLLVGTEDSKNTFCSTAHGSGRTMSRNKAAKIFGKDIKKYLDNLWKEKGIYIKSTSFMGVAEETGESYKDINEVINSTHLAGISKPVVRFLPIGNCKG